MNDDMQFVSMSAKGGRSAVDSGYRTVSWWSRQNLCALGTSISRFCRLRSTDCRGLRSDFVVTEIVSLLWNTAPMTTYITFTGSFLSGITV